MNRAEMAHVVVLSRHGSKEKKINPGLTDIGKLQVVQGAEQRVKRYGRGGLFYVSSELPRAGQSKDILIANTAPLEIVSFAEQKSLLDRGENPLLNEPFQLTPDIDPKEYSAEWQAFWTVQGHAFPNDGVTREELGDQMLEAVRVPHRKTPHDLQGPEIIVDNVGHSGNLLAFALSNHVEPHEQFLPVLTGGSEALERQLPSASWVEFTRIDNPDSPHLYKVTRLGLVRG